MQRATESQQGQDERDAMGHGGGVRGHGGSETQGKEPREWKRDRRVSACSEDE